MNSTNTSGQFITGDPQVATRTLQLQLVTCVNNLIQSTAEADRQRQDLLQSALNTVSMSEFSRRMNTIDEKLDKLTDSLQTLASSQSAQRLQLSHVCTTLETKLGLRMGFVEKAFESQLLKSRNEAQEETKKVIEMFEKSQTLYMGAFNAIFDRVNRMQQKLGEDLDTNKDSGVTYTATLSERVNSIGATLNDVLDGLKNTNDKRACPLLSKLTVAKRSVHRSVVDATAQHLAESLPHAQFISTTGNRCDVGVNTEFAMGEHALFKRLSLF
jgi:hypothetical protein